MTDNAARFALGFAALVALTACGGGGGDAAPIPAPPPAPVPVPGPPSPPPPAPTPAPTPVSVQSMQPSDGTTKVDIRPVLRIVLSDSVDASSVTTRHVQLLSRGYPQRITLSYDDASHTISIAPGTLGHDMAYTLAVSGLVDTHGNVIAAQQATFSTWINYELGAAYPDGSSSWPITLDANGRPTTGPAPDSPFASDYASYDYLPGGLLSDVTSWKLGSDLTTYSIDHIAHSAYDGNGALLSLTTTFYNQAPYVIPHSSDTRETYTYDAHGAQVLYTWAVASTDGLFDTADDQVNYHTRSYDAQGNVTLAIAGSQIDSDGRSIPVSAITSYSRFVPAASGSPERVMNYNAAGPDGQFLTADDVLNSYSELTRDGRGNTTRLVRYDVPFGSPAGTALAVSEYEVSTFDSHDNLAQRTIYVDPGPDGTWFTADDVVLAVVTYDTTH